MEGGVGVGGLDLSRVQVRHVQLEISISCPHAQGTNVSSGETLIYVLAPACKGFNMHWSRFVLFAVAILLFKSHMCGKRKFPG